MSEQVLNWNSKSARVFTDSSHTADSRHNSNENVEGDKFLWKINII